MVGVRNSEEGGIGVKMGPVLVLFSKLVLFFLRRHRFFPPLKFYVLAFYEFSAVSALLEADCQVFLSVYLHVEYFPSLKCSSVLTKALQILLLF